jgi:transposase
VKWPSSASCKSPFAASRTKDTYWAAQYKRMIVRKGKKRTIVAVAHSMLVMAYYLQKRQCTYQELGGDYFDRLDEGALRRRLVKRLVGLGYQVDLTPIGPEPEPNTEPQPNTTQNDVLSHDSEELT